MTDCLSSQHYAEVRGWDTETGELCFRVPITVVLPALPAADNTVAFTGLEFMPGKIHRQFVSVPAGELSTTNDFLRQCVQVMYRF